MIRKTALALLLAAAGINAHAALSAGDIAFTSFNADEDSWAIVALKDISANTSVYFSDNEWNGSAWIDTNEHSLVWNSGAQTIAAGTVVSFLEIDASPDVISASIGTLSMAAGTGTNLGLSKSNETFYAFLGTSAAAPTTFLTAITTEADSALASTTNAGLTIGLNATALSNDADFGEYTAARAGLATFGAYAPLVFNNTNWTMAGSGEFTGQALNTTAFSVTAVPEPKNYAMFLAGLGLMGLIARRQSNR